MPELITEARTRGAEIIQVNHPRDSTGYFDTVGFDPNLGTLLTNNGPLILIPLKSSMVRVIFAQL